MMMRLVFMAVVVAVVVGVGCGSDGASTDGVRGTATVAVIPTTTAEPTVEVDVVATETVEPTAEVNVVETATATVILTATQAVMPTVEMVVEPTAMPMATVEATKVATGTMVVAAEATVVATAPVISTATAEPIGVATGTVAATTTAVVMPTAEPIATAAAEAAARAAVVIGGVEFEVDVADTPALRSKGLGERDGLAAQTGMLFVFPEEGTPIFWMKGMRFPLDFVWIGAGCRVVDITEDVPHAEAGTPDELLALYAPAAPVLYTFEINAGEVERFGIEVGDDVRFRNIQSEFAGC